MCARIDGAREVRLSAERLLVACARLGAQPVEEETPGWARELLGRIDAADERDGAGDRSRH
jgi:hypothetical protein